MSSTHPHLTNVRIYEELLTFEGMMIIVSFFFLQLYICCTITFDLKINPHKRNFSSLQHFSGWQGLVVVNYNFVEELQMDHFNIVRKVL